MSQSLSVEELCDKIWDIEEKFSLLDLQIAGIKIWQYVRMKMYYAIAQKTGVFSRHFSKEIHKESRLQKAGRFFNSLVTGNPLLDKRRRDVLVFPHARKVESNGERIDIYTKYFVDELKAEGVNYQAYERHFAERVCVQERFPRRHFELIDVLFPYYRKFRKVNFTAEERQQIAAVNQALQTSFNIEFDLLTDLDREIARFRLAYGIFYKVLKNKQPKKIYLVVSYGWMGPLIKAAKDLGIETIEFQHGTFSDYHLGYSFPGRQTPIEAFPDRFLVWNEFWKGMCKLPIPSSRVDVYSFKHFDRERLKFTNVQKKPRQIVVISQGAIGHKMADAVLKNIPDLQDYQVMYKLHPGERSIWQDNPSLVKLSKFSNVRVLTDNTIPLYQLLAESKYLVGVFSTAVFEGLDFGCELILLDLPGIEYMKNLITQGTSKLVTANKRIKDFLN